MAVNIKLGTTIFTKERRIADLETQVKDLERKLKEYESVNYDFQVRHKEDEKMIFEMRNINNLKSIENQQLSQSISKIINEKDKLEAQLQEINSNYENLKGKLKEIMNETTRITDELLEKSALVDRLSSDLQKSENQQISLEKEIDQMCQQREARMADIRTLQKNIQQKDKFIAILNKEKEKNENSRFSKENKPKTTSYKNNQYQSGFIIDALSEVSQVQMMDRLKQKQK